MPMKSLSLAIYFNDLQTRGAGLRKKKSLKNPRTIVLKRI
jgi:hypothetical protein